MRECFELIPDQMPKVQQENARLSWLLWDVHSTLDDAVVMSCLEIIYRNAKLPSVRLKIAAYEVPLSSVDLSYAHVLPEQKIKGCIFGRQMTRYSG